MRWSALITNVQLNKFLHVYVPVQTSPVQENLQDLESSLIRPAVSNLLRGNHSSDF